MVSSSTGEEARPSILFIDDDADIIKAARLLVERQDMRLTGVPDPAAAWVKLAEERFDLILLDLNFARGRTSGEEGFAMLDRLIAADPHAIVIVVTGHSGINVAVQAMRAGASDFVIKPWNNERLLATITRGLALRRAREEARPVPQSGAEEHLLLGEDPAIQRARALAERVAPTDAAVLIQGPPGAGKSQLARLVHHLSRHASAPLVTLACSTVADPDTLVGRVAEARGGTLLLDEVAALAPPLQPLLVEALDDVRLIATSRAGRDAVRAALQEDLLYRVNTVEIALPPLSARGGDSLLLARHFLGLFAARYGQQVRPLSPEAERAIASDAWPDDVRGLRQAMERAVLLGSGESYAPADFALTPDPAAPVARAAAADLNLQRSERSLVEAALRRHAFNVSRAAAELGLTRAALYRRMAKYGL